MTHSNDDCTVHLLSDVSPGALVRVRSSDAYWIKRPSGPEDPQPYLNVKRGEVLMFVGREALDLNDEDKVVPWNFTFYHKDLGNIELYWDMNLDDEVDLDVLLELVD